jgi:AcrR family transcriptional regulator
MDGRSERKVKNRIRIVSAAGVVIGRDGIDGLSMRVLSEEAEVSVATLYNLFDSREVIVRAVFEQALGELAPKFGKLKGTSDLGDLRNKFSAALDLVYRSVSAPLFLAFSEDPSNASLFHGEHRATDALVPELMSALQRGELRKETDITDLRSVLEAVVYTAFRLDALGVITAKERRHRIRSGAEFALLAHATPKGRRALLGKPGTT